VHGVTKVNVASSIIFSLDIQATMSSHTEDIIRQSYLDLQDARDSAATDLQRNVYRNYTEFVSISKEISNILFL